MTYCDTYDVTTIVKHFNKGHLKPLKGSVAFMCYNILFYGNYCEVVSLLNKNKLPIVDLEYVFLYERDNKRYASEHSYYLHAFSERYKVFA